MLLRICRVHTASNQNSLMGGQHCVREGCAEGRPLVQRPRQLPLYGCAEGFGEGLF